MSSDLAPQNQTAKEIQNIDLKNEFINLRDSLSRFIEAQVKQKLSSRPNCVIESTLQEASLTQLTQSVDAELKQIFIRFEEEAQKKITAACDNYSTTTQNLLLKAHSDGSYEELFKAEADIKKIADLTALALYMRAGTRGSTAAIYLPDQIDIEAGIQRTTTLMISSHWYRLTKESEHKITPLLHEVFDPIVDSTFKLQAHPIIKPVAELLDLENIEANRREFLSSQMLGIIPMRYGPVRLGLGITLFDIAKGSPTTPNVSLTDYEPIIRAAAEAIVLADKIKDQ